MLGNPEQSIERGNGAGSDDVISAPDSLDPRWMNRDSLGQSQCVDGALQKVAAQLSRLGQRHRPLCEDRNHKPRKTRAGADVQPGRVGTWRKADELGGVGDIAV